MKQGNKPRKRILFILHLPPPVHGAAVVGDLIRHSGMITDVFDCRFINLATANGLGDIGKFKFTKIRHFATLLREINKTIRSFNPDLIYITPNSAGNAFYKDWLTVKFLKRKSKPIVAHFHNKGVAKNASNVIKSALYKDFFSDIDIILLSKRLQSDIQRFASSDQIHICPNGMPDLISAASPRPVSGTPHILFLSNLLVDKGILTLLDALKILNQNGYEFVCDIAGAETAEIDKTRLEQEIENRSLTAKTIFHGAVYSYDKVGLFNNSDIFVFPSQNEAFPLVCIEAMQYSIPIITTDEGGIPDMVIDGYNGYICTDHRPESLAQNIAKLISDRDLRQRMGQNCRKHYEQHFTLNSFEKNLCDILDKIS